MSNQVKTILRSAIRVGFHYGPRPKEPSKLSDPIGRAQNFGSREFTLVFKVRKTQGMLMLYGHLGITFLPNLYGPFRYDHVVDS